MRIFAFICVCVVMLCFCCTGFADGGTGWFGVRVRSLADVDKTVDPADGDVLEYDSTTELWVPTAAAGGHDEVTLDTNADTVLSIADQEIGLDDEVANYVFAGPATGADDTPTFRALVDADIPNDITITEADPYAAILNGRAGGQTLKGGTQAGDDLSFWTNSTGTVGSYFFTDLTDNGFVKTSGGTGLLSIDTNTYLTAETDPTALLTAGTDNVKDTHIDWGTGAGQVSGSDLPNEDVGDVTITGGAFAVEDDSHAHTGASLSGIDISSDTNLTAGDHITLTDDDLDVDDDFLLNTGDVGTGDYDFGGAVVEIPNGTSGTTNATGETYLDTNGDGGTNFNGPVVQIYTGAANAYLFPIALPLAASQDDYIMKYDASAKTIGWEADTGAGGGGAWDDITDPDADTTIAMGGYETLFTSTLNEANHVVLKISNTTADLTADTYLNVLQFTDDGDANGFFFDCRDNAGDSKFLIGPDGILTTGAQATFGGSGQSTITKGLVVNNGGTGAGADEDFTVKSLNVDTAINVDASGDTANIDIPLTINDYNNQACLTVDNGGTGNTVYFHEGGTSRFKLYDGGILDIPSQSSARAYRNGTQTISTGTWTKVQMNAESWDTQNEFDGSTNYRFTAGKAGKYLVTASIYIGVDTDGKWFVGKIYVNGSGVRATACTTGSANTPSVRVSSVVSLAANDYVEIYIYHNKGSDADIVNDATGTSVEIVKLM